MNTNVTGVMWFSKIFASFYVMDERSPNIGRLKATMHSYCAELRSHGGIPLSWAIWEWTTGSL